MSDDDLDNLSPNPFGIASDESDPINSVFSSPAEMRILVVESFSTMRRIIRRGRAFDTTYASQSAF